MSSRDSIEMSSRNVCFTINNYTQEDIDQFSNWDQITYVVYGKEVGENGTPHLQGYVEFKSSKKFTTIKKKFPRAHLEARRGSASQAADYCKKDGEFVEKGEVSEQGKRSDIEEATEMLIAGHRMRQVALANPTVYVKYHKGLQAFQAVILEPRNEVPEVTVLYGTTGTGKSKTSREMLSDPYVWGPEQGTWFDGYEGQKEVIFEEFRGQLPFGMMLRLLDRYDCKVQYKGGMIQFIANKIVITSPKHPKFWYCDDSQDKVDQLMRRITEIKCLDKV